MFQKGEEVLVVRHCKPKKEKPVKLTVVADERSEIDLKDAKGEVTTFAHFRNSGWKMLFPNPFGGGRCFSPNGDTYSIVKA